MTNFSNKTRRAGYSAIGAAALMLAACGGGGGGGGGVNSSPFPMPTPTPTPSGPPPLPAGPIGLTGPLAAEAASSQLVFTSSDGSYSGVTIAAGSNLMTISHSVSDNSYTVSLPDYVPGTLVNSRGNGSYDLTGWVDVTSTSSDVTTGATATQQPVDVTLAWPASSPYAYTDFGSWHGSEDLGGGQTRYRMGIFAYGSPTAAGAVPMSGTGTYQGTVRAMNSTGYENIWGNVGMTFDFAGGSLSGQLTGMSLSDGWDAWALPDMTFRDTVFGAGSTTFSGAFASGGVNLNSAFSGRFTGPAGNELMAHFSSAFTNPIWQGADRMTGVWIAKRP